MLLAVVLAVGTVAVAQFPVPPDPTTPAHGDIPETTNTPQRNGKALTFSSRAEYVLVPVIVTDKLKHHVAGLTKDDFTLLENGKSRPISSVEEVRSDPAPTGAAIGSRQSSSDVRKVSVRKPIAIIALDLINTPEKYQLPARRAIIDLLLQTAEHGAMIELLTVRSKGITVVHDFSEDPQELLAALRDVHSELTGTQAANDSASAPVMRDAISKTRVRNKAELLSFATQADREDATAQQGNAAALTLVALQRIAASVAEVPGRKSLVWLTAGVPFQLDTKYLSNSPSMMPFEHAMQMLNQANVAVYPVDVRGLELLGLDGSEHLPVGAGGGPAIQQAMSAISVAHSATISSMIGVAEMTGGRAFFNRNDTKGEVADALQEGNDYYLLSYPLNKADRRPGWRSLTVRTRDGSSVSARKGFYVTQNTEDPSLTHDYDIANAVASPLPFTSLPVRAEFLGKQIDGDKGKIIIFQMAVAPGTLSPTSDKIPMLDVDLWVVATDVHGNAASTISQPIHSGLDAEAVEKLQKDGLQYKSSFDLPFGDYTVHFVVRDNSTGRTGSFITRLKVG